VTVVTPAWFPPDAISSEQARATIVFIHYAQCRVDRHVDPHPVLASHLCLARVLVIQLFNDELFRELFQAQALRLRRMKKKLCPFCGVGFAKFDMNEAQVMVCPRCYKETPLEDLHGARAPVLDRTKDRLIEILGGQPYE